MRGIKRRTKKEFQSSKYLQILEYNKLCTEVLSLCNDDYINSVFNVYENFFSYENSENFNSFIDSIRKGCLDKLTSLISDLEEDLEKGNIDEEKVVGDLVSCAVDYYCFELSCYICETYNVCADDIFSFYSKFFVNEVTSRNFDCLDGMFIKKSIKRFDTLFNNANKSSKIITELFVEENNDLILEKIKEPVFSSIEEVLRNICGIDLDFDLSDLNVEEDVCSDEDKIVYIDDYKRLNKMALDKGFSFVRCRGDHGIYKNKNGLVVVIPQGRSIGKGLSCKIQKAISSL